MIAATQRKGPAEGATSPSRGSENPRKENPMNKRNNSICTHGAAIPVDPGITIGRIQSLMNVCALALAESQDWSDKHRERAAEDIGIVLRLGVDVADQAIIQIGRMGVAS